MTELPQNCTYQDIKAHVLKHTRGLAPGKYLADHLEIVIERIEAHFQVKIRLGFYSWLMIYTAKEFELQEVAA